MKTSKYILSLSAATLLAAATGAQAAIISATFNVTDAQLPTLQSGTLDAPCVTNAPGSFFTCASPTATAIAITPQAGGGGTITLKYDDATGQVTEITNMDMYVSDMTIVITSFVSGTVGVASGNSAPVVNDFPRLRAGTGATNASADEDQNADVNIFQHDAPGVQTDATDFATFTDIVDTCVGSACALIPVLNIDALRYEIQGIVSGGVYNGALRAETSNNSNYFVNFQATVVPLPAAGWLLLTAVGGLAARQWKKRAA